ncbi:5' DNA nuclease [Agrobacterium vitis]|uniref:5' DNA nuclease n=1 Tax=Agrobacterium vitis TaxID=373 RepID=A0AAE4WIL0_AGRVI|nr:5' DNA nuclease [Agrobacterium vitis]MCF1500716.1 5' DNA nuclease [Allorhizobium sp. Av2]MCM2442029.1 5' DNA nuclease [Agrobacterium vitis]MUZ59687.1 5' DNA nuclease [Agrobacterium vitis]MVA67106.1 5' DNA nuclease [Agrobacterium vitis]MVA89168.1 5' DNA nuclease [Agrobacterium vitis]
MVEASKRTGTDASAKPADTSRGAETAGSSLHALMANPMAAFAAATVLGFGFATQMTGVMLGSMQTMMDKPARRTKDDVPEDKADDQISAASVLEVNLKPETQLKPVDAPVSDAAVPPKAAPARRPVAKAKSKPQTAKPVRSQAVQSAKKPTVAPVTPIAEPEVKAAPVAVKPARRRGKKVDLKAIGGVGPKVQEMLSKLGVHGLDDIATWTPEDAARIDAELGLDGRILRDDWIGQARKLTGA